MVVGSLVALIWLAFYPPGPIGLPIRFGMVFTLFVLGLSQWQPRALVNPIIGWIGKVSYSGYLVHFALLSSVAIPNSNYLEAFALLTALTVAISSVTYLCIEEPGNKLGRYVIRKLREAQDSTNLARGTAIVEVAALSKLCSSTSVETGDIDIVRTLANTR